MNPSPAVQRLLGALVAVLFLGGLVGVAAVDEDSETVNTASGSTTTTTTGSSDDLGLGSVAPAPTTETVGGVSVAPTNAPPTTRAAGTPTTAASSAGAKDPGPSTPPKLGLYRYKSVSDGQTKTAQVRIERDADQAANEQRFLYKVQEQEGSSEITQALAWRADGIYLRSTSFPNPMGAEPVHCDWEPDLMQLRLPQKAGNTWTMDGTCKAKFGTNDATFHLTGTGKTVGLRRITVAGKTLDVWQNEETSHLTVDLTYNGQPIHFETDTTSTSFFSPPHGVQVKSSEKTRTKDASGKTTDRSTEREILKLDPS